MIKIQEQIPLAKYTTFKVGGNARYFCAVQKEDELIEAITFAREKKLATLIVGGGSNILICDEGFDGLVIKIEIKGIQEKLEDKNNLDCIVSAGAGEGWDDFVAYTVTQGLYGLENLSSIPGTVGAAPVQNIGAYGVEAADTIYSVRALDTTTMKFVELSNKACRFTYRDSLFKHEKGRYVIVAVDFKLSKNVEVNTEYRDLKDYFEKKGVKPASNKEIRDAVIAIRATKLPDWKYWGTAGSFFKNPIVSSEKFAELKKTYPELPGFPEPDGRIKISLGWILDKVCNMKGLKNGSASVYEKQALVLVAEPGSSATDVMNLARNLMACVKEKTGIDIEGEVEWVC